MNNRRNRSPHRSGVRAGAVFALSALVASCVHPGANGAQPLARHPSTQRTCLVLSVGGFRGVAHIGAIRALTEDAGIHFDCVVGNSMGSLIGAMYATQPLATEERFRQFLNGYAAATRAEVTDNGLGAGLFTALVVIFSGGSALLAAGAGALVGNAAAGATPPIDHARVLRVLRQQLGSVEIRSLPIRFATGYVERDRDGLRPAYSPCGDLVTAIGASIANPFLFPDVRLPGGRVFDAGGDREHAVPIDEACTLFPDARLIAVNVTGQPSLRSSEMHCPVDEIVVDVSRFNDAEIAAQGNAFDAAMLAGYSTGLQYWAPRRHR